MILGDTVSLALRNLRQSKLRTTLTALGVSIGIASLAGMVSLGVGLQEQFVGRFMKSGVFDSITVTPGRAIARGGLFGRGGGRRGGGGANAANAPGPAPEPDKPLNDDAIAALLAIPDVRDAYPNIRVPLQVKYDKFQDFTVVMGVPMSSKDEGAFQTLTAGEFFANDTDNTCMVSLDFAKQLNETNPKDLVGKDLVFAYASAPGAPLDANSTTSTVSVGPAQIQSTETKFRIVGIVERDPSGPFGGGSVSGVMITIPRAKALSSQAVNVSTQALLRGTLGATPVVGAGKQYEMITVKVKKAQSTQDVEDKIKAMGYSAFSLSDALAQAKRAFIILDLLLSLIGSIALAVSSLGIVNTMVMSILERTREIGIMKAVGGSDADVRGIFLVEASSIGLLGGVVGVTLGWIVGRIINFFANIYIKSQGGEPSNLFSLPWWLILGSIGFALFVSLIAGSYPARRAARLDPIQALRHD